MWVFSTKVLVPSDLVGCIKPANYLNMKKAVLFPETDIDELLNNTNPKIIIFGKCLHENMIKLAAQAKKKNIITISCFNDWHFNALSTKQEKQFKLNYKLFKKSDYVVVKTNYAKEIIRLNLGSNSHVIPDCLRFNGLEIPESFQNDLEILWFGAPTNHDTLLKGLNEIEEKKIKINVNVVTIISDTIIQELNDKNFQYIRIRLFPFSDKTLLNLALQSKAIIIPLINDHARHVKSSNRIIDSLNFGRFLIKSYTDANREFDKYCYVGNIGEGIEWLRKNENESRNMIIEGQNYVQNNYSVESVSEIWLKFFEKIIKKSAVS